MTPTLRVSDAEREHVVNTLRDHTAEGRLSIDEFSQRSQAAYAARTQMDLDALTHDLPTPAQPSNQSRATISRPAWTLAIVIATIVLLLGLLGIALLATMIGHMSNMPM